METRIKERLTGALILVALFVILVPELLSGGSQRAGGDGVPEARPASEGPPLVTYRMPLEGSTESASGQAALNVLPSQQADRLPPPVPTAVPQEPAAKPEPIAAPAAAAPAAAAPAPAAESPPAKAEKQADEPKPVESKPVEPKPADKDKSAKDKAAKDKAAKDKAAKDKAAQEKAAREKVSDKGWFVQLGVFAKRENAELLVKQVGKKGQTAHITGSGTALRVRVGPVADRGAAQALRKRLAGDGFNGTLVPP